MWPRRVVVMLAVLAEACGSGPRPTDNSAPDNSAPNASGASLTAQTERCGGSDCPTGETCCGVYCVDLQIDQDDCGRCGNSCENVPDPITSLSRTVWTQFVDRDREGCYCASGELRSRAEVERTSGSPFSCNQLCTEVGATCVEYLDCPECVRCSELSSGRKECTCRII